MLQHVLVCKTVFLTAGISTLAEWLSYNSYIYIEFPFVLRNVLLQGYSSQFVMKITIMSSIWKIYWSIYFNYDGTGTLRY